MSVSTDALNPFAPGFDFLQKLAQGAAAPSGGGSFPQWNDWVAPTMNVQDLEKRINELKTVLFWLEQNQRALAATIQAMEVQKMTLSALQTMNVPVDNWASTMLQSWQQFAQVATPIQAASSADPASHVDADSPLVPDIKGTNDPKTAANPQVEESITSGADPLQWWGALTQQFQHIAQQAMHDVAQHAMEHASTTQQAAANAAQAMAAATPKRTAAASKKAATPAAAKPKAPAKRAAVPARKAAPARKR